MASIDDWNNLAPRLAIAWSPSFKSGLLNRLFNGRRTVLRGGFAIVYDRINTFESVIIPSLGAGFSQRSLTWVRMPSLRASQRSRKVFLSASLLTAANSSPSAASSFSTALSSAAGAKSFSFGTVYAKF